MVGWDSVKSLFSEGLSTESNPRTFAMIQPKRAADFGGAAPPANQCYVKVTLARMQLRDRRFLTKEYYPVVHSFVELSRQGADRVVVPFVAGPAQLADLGKGQEQVILAKNIDLLGPTPYIGGSVNVAIGLCAAVAKDYLDNLLGVLGSISGVVGGTALSGALNVIAPLKSGAEALLGMSGQVTLKVGVVNGFSPIDAALLDEHSTDQHVLLDGYYALVNIAEAAHIGPWLHFVNGQLFVEVEGRELRPVVEDHLVFQISQHATMTDWSRIPGLYNARGAVLNAVINEGLVSDNFREEFAAFKRAIVTNADIVAADRVVIVKGLEAEAADFAAGKAPVELHEERDPREVLAATAAMGPSLEEARKIPVESL